MSYNKDIDYQEKINEAVKKGDYVSAAKLEQSRNEKIDSEGLNYEKTNRYKGWLDDTDYSIELKKQMNSGASKNTVSKTLKKRVEKASGTDGLIHYAYDDVYDEAVKYIMGESGFNANEKPAEYKNNYNIQANKLLNKILKREEFSYNPFEDELYKYYTEAYRREGERSMEDLLGKLSANTGGSVNSYALTAARQASDYYNSKIADVVPELYNLHYDMYLDSLGSDIKELDIINSLEEAEYNRYRDKVEDYESKRDFDYKRFIDSLEEENYRREAERKKELEDREYNLLLEELSDAREKGLRDYELEIAKMLKDEEEAEKDRAYKESRDKIEQALDKWKIMGYLDKESARILNLPAYLRVSD